MVKRYIRNTVITAKVETTPGTDAAPTGADNAILVSEMSITPLDAQNVDRALVRGFFGGNEQLVGVASVKCAFTVELAGSGTAATPPAWGPLLLACAMAQAELTTPARVEYTPISDALKTLTVYYYDAGVVHKLVGSMGNCTLSAKRGERPVLRFEVTGLDGGIAAASTTGVYAAWKKPLVMKMGNVVDVTLGAVTYATGALTGGTVYPSTGFEIMFGNAVSFTPLLSEESVDVTNRDMTGSVELDLTAAQEVEFMDDVKNNVTQGFGFTIGSAAGSKIIIYSPSVQLINPKKVDLDGRRLVGYDMRLVPVSGNDELRIVCA